MDALPRWGTYDQTQPSPSDSVNQEQGGDSENDLDGSVAQRRVKSLLGSVADVGEDSGTVEGDDWQVSTGNREYPVHLLLIPHIC
jgi:hypothetical protein